MRGVVVSGWLLAMLLLGAPGVAAQDEEFEEIELQISPDGLVVLVRAGVADGDARDVREEIDEEYGNDDGVVTRDEVDAFRADKLTLDSDHPECFEDFGLLSLDGKNPVALSSVEQDAFGAEGPISSGARIITTAAISFRYAEAEGSAVEAVVNLMRFDGFGLAIGCVFSNGMDWSQYAGGWSGTGPPYYGGSSGPYYPPGCCAADGAQIPLPVLGRPTLETEQDDQQEQPGSETGFRFLIRPSGSATIDPSSIRPESARSYWDGRGLEARDEQSMAAMTRQPVSFTLNGEGGGILQGTVSGPGAVAMASAGAGLLALGLLLSTEYTRWLLWRGLFWVPGFSRLEKDEVLQHDRRGELYAYIKDNPGACFSDLKRVTELANGALVHHLRILEQQEYVRPIRDGFRTRFYMRGPRVQPEPYLTRVQQELLDTISANPGLTQKELTQLLGIPRESVSYHAKRLATQGQVQVRPDGKWRRYYTPEPKAKATPA